MTQKIKLRWVLAHIPYDLFLRSASIFSRTVNERSNGLVEIEVLGLDEYQEKYNNGKAIDRYAVLDMVNDGIIEMSQMHSTQLGRINQDLRVLDLPFLFENHEHAVRVLDGEIGQTLLSDLAKKSNVRGLAFTYSGGFRMVVANKPITRVEDLAGERVRVAFSPVAEDTFSTVGATPVPMSVNQTAVALRDNLVDLAENTWARYFRAGVNEHSTHVSNTKHSLFLTSIIINEQIWNSLPIETQIIMREAALEAAREERIESLEDGVKAMHQCADHGISVHEWSNEEHARLKDNTSSVYEKYQNILPAGLIEKIKKT